MAGIAHEEDSAPEWFAAQFPNIGEVSVGMFWDWMNAQADALGSGSCLKWCLVSRVKLTMHHEPMGIGKPEISTGHPITKAFRFINPRNKGASMRRQSNITHK